MEDDGNNNGSDAIALVLDDLHAELLKVVLSYACRVTVKINGNRPGSSNIPCDVFIRYVPENDEIEYEAIRQPQIRIHLNRPGCVVNLENFRLNPLFSTHLYYRLLPAFVREINEAYNPTVSKKWYDCWKSAPVWKTLASYILTTDYREHVLNILGDPENRLSTDKVSAIHSCFQDLYASMEVHPPDIDFSEREDGVKNENEDENTHNYGSLPITRFTKAIDLALGLSHGCIDTASSHPSDRTISPRGLRILALAHKRGRLESDYDPFDETDEVRNRLRKRRKKLFDSLTSTPSIAIHSMRQMRLEIDSEKEEESYLTHSLTSIPKIEEEGRN